MKRLCLPALVLILAIGCSSDAIAPARRPQIQFLSGNATSDTVDAIISQPLAIIVHDSNGALAPVGTTVRFAGGIYVDTTSGLPPGATFGTSVRASTTSAFDVIAVDTTDASGRAEVMVKLGTHAGPVYVVITVPAFGVVDTAWFTVQPGAAVHLAIVPSSRVLTTGRTYQLTGGLADRYGNIRTDPVTWSGVGIGVSASGTITPTNVGQYRIIAHAANVTDTGMVSVVPIGRIVARWGSRIIAFDLDGSNTDTVVKAVTGASIGSPRWIPGTNTIVYTQTLSNGPITLMRVDATSHVTGPGTVFLNPAVPAIINADAPMPTTNGAWVYFGGHNNACSENNYCLYRANANGSNATLFSVAQSQAQVTEFSPAPSPDGSRVAFVGDSAGYSMIRIIDVATSTLEPLGVHGVYPSWSPNGTHIAYISAFDGTLMAMNSDGSNQRAVVASGQIYGQTYARQSIAWSPDSQWLVLYGGLAGIIYGGPYQGTSLELVSVATGQVIPLSYAMGMDSPSWKQ